MHVCVKRLVRGQDLGCGCHVEVMYVKGLLSKDGVRLRLEGSVLTATLENAPLGVCHMSRECKAKHNLADSGLCRYS